MTALLKTVKNIFLSLSITIIMGVGITAHAQPNGDCVIDKQPISITDIARTTAFFPVVPEVCALEDGKAQPLTLSVLPDVLIRLFGALTSVLFYLFFFIVLFSGIQYTYGGIDGSSSKLALKNLQEATMGLVLVLVAYTVINTLVIFLAPNLKYTSFESFFVPFSS